MNPIKFWLEQNGDYKQGIELYERYGNNKTWLSTFINLGETEFTYEQLSKQLTACIEATQATTQQLAELTYKQLKSSSPPSDLQTAPQSIKDAVERRKHLYAVVNREHERLVAYVESQTEFSGKLSGEIKMRDVIKSMDRLTLAGEPIPFNLIAITANRHKDVGGEILHLQHVYQYKYQKKWEGDKVSSNFEKLPTIKTGGNSNPLANRVRRIFLPETSEIKNVDMVLITHFNWRRMIY